MNQNTPTISVVVIAKNEEATISYCLDALVCQSVRPDKVVIVVNNSTDKTLNIVQNLYISPYRWMKCVSFMNATDGIVRARMQGFEEAKGDIILCLDGDSIPADNWVQVMRDLLSEHDNMLVGSYVKQTGVLYCVIQNFLNSFFYPSRGKKALPWLWGTSFAVKAKDVPFVQQYLRASIELTARLQLSRNPEDYIVALMVSKTGNIEVTRKTCVVQKVKECSSWQLILRTIENVRNSKKIDKELQ